MLPLLSILLVALLGVFWGVGAGVVMLGFLVFALLLLWFLSPLITGLWLGQLIIGRSNWFALLIGVIPIVVLGAIPYFGLFVYLISFIFALGGLVLARRLVYDTPPPPTVTTSVPTMT